MALAGLASGSRKKQEAMREQLDRDEFHKLHLVASTDRYCRWKASFGVHIMKS